MHMYVNVSALASVRFVLIDKSELEEIYLKQF